VLHALQPEETHRVFIERGVAGVWARHASVALIAGRDGPFIAAVQVVHIAIHAGDATTAQPLVDVSTRAENLSYCSVCILSWTYTDRDRA